MNPAFLWFGAGALGVYGYATGRISNIIGNIKTKTETSPPTKSAQSQAQTLNERPQTIIVQPSNTGRMSYVLPLGCACFIGLGGYYYYIHSNGTKKVIHKVKETAQETQDLVQKTDDNNSKRFDILDKKNEDRAQNLELQIRSEQRAGFNIISEQIYCLTQVAIQTLSAVASSSTANDHSNESNITNEKLLGYCDKAQEMADTILSDDHLLKAKENNLKDIKAEIQIQQQQQQVIMMKSDDITPGGPPRRSEFDLKQEAQSPHVIKHSQMDEADNDNDDILSKLTKTVKPLQMAYYVYDNKQYIVLSSAIILALYIGNKTIDYFNPETTQSTVSTHK